MERGGVIIIMDGGLGGAIAAAMESERGTPVVAWATRPGSPLSRGDMVALDAHAAADLVRAQAELYGATETVLPEPAAHPERDEDAATLLFETLRGAAARACERIVWPIAAGDDVETMFRVTERAHLANRLAALDAEERGRPAVRIETPFVDLQGDQMMDLAHDLEIDSGIWAAPRAGRAAVA